MKRKCSAACDAEVEIGRTIKFQHEGDSYFRGKPELTQPDLAVRLELIDMLVKKKLMESPTWVAHDGEF